MKVLEDANRPQGALAGLSKDKSLPKVHRISFASLSLLLVMGSEVLCAVFFVLFFIPKPFSFSEKCLHIGF